MLKKKEEKHEKLKDVAYYALKIEELRAKLKNLSLVGKGLDEDEDTYQMFSYGSNDEEMHHLTHGAMFAKHSGEVSGVVYMCGEIMSDGKVWSDEGNNVEGRCFMVTIMPGFWNAFKL